MFRAYSVKPCVGFLPALSEMSKAQLGQCTRIYRIDISNQSVHSSTVRESCVFLETVPSGPFVSLAKLKCSFTMATVLCTLLQTLVPSVLPFSQAYRFRVFQKCHKDIQGFKKCNCF